MKEYDFTKYIDISIKPKVSIARGYQCTKLRCIIPETIEMKTIGVNEELLFINGIHYLLKGSTFIKIINSSRFFCFTFVSNKFIIVDIDVYKLSDSDYLDILIKNECYEEACELRDKKLKELGI